jgi:hypothetical protein
VAFGRALAEERVWQRGTALGFRYVDGHVRVYHGRHRLPKAHVARMRLSMPATSHYWVSDRAGDPLFVVTAEANAGWVKLLPAIVREGRRLVGKRRVTFVFDRGGYSPKLFLAIVAAGFDLLTYRRGRYPRISEALLQQRRRIRKPVQLLAETIVQILSDTQPLALADLQELPLQPFALCDVAQHRHQTPPPSVGYLGQGEIEDDPDTILAPAHNLISVTHPPLFLHFQQMTHEIRIPRLVR